MAEATNWDVEKLRKELKKQREIRDNLITTNDRMRKAVYESQIMVKDIPNEENIWRDRFMQQQTYNTCLQDELTELERKVEDLQSQAADGPSTEHTYDNMSETGIRQLLRQLEKEKKELEWQLRECEWRLDQEAGARHKAEEEKKVMSTQVEHIAKDQANSSNTHLHR